MRRARQGGRGKGTQLSLTAICQACHCIMARASWCPQGSFVYRGIIFQATQDHSWRSPVELDNLWPYLLYNPPPNGTRKEEGRGKGETERTWAHAPFWGWWKRKTNNERDKIWILDGESPALWCCNWQMDPRCNYLMWRDLPGQPRKWAAILGNTSVSTLPVVKSPLNIC